MELMALPQVAPDDLQPVETIMDKPAISRAPSGREDLFVFRIDGRIRKADIEAMAETLDEAFMRLGVVDILIVITRWDGIDLGAAFDSKALGAQARANSHVRRYAVVGAPSWAAAMINMFAPLTPVEEKTFEGEYEAQAWAWIDEGRKL